MKKIGLKQLVPPVFLLFCSVLCQEASTASALGRSGVNDVRISLRPSHDRNDRKLDKVIEVIEDRMNDRRLPAKVVQKLSTMPEKDFRLVSALCDRLAKEGDSTGADVALLLVTALIVVS